MFSEKRAGTIGELSIRIDRALETFYLFVIRECVDVSCMYHRRNKMEEGGAGSGQDRVREI